MSKREIRRRVTALEERLPSPELGPLGQAHWRLIRGYATDEDLRIIIEDKVSGLWTAALQLAEERETDTESRVRHLTDVKGTVAAIVATTPDDEVDSLFNHLQEIAYGPAPSFLDRLEKNVARLWLAFFTEQRTQEIREMFALRMHQYWVRRYSFESWLRKVQTRSGSSGSRSGGQKWPETAR